MSTYESPSAIIEYFITEPSEIDIEAIAQRSLGRPHDPSADLRYHRLT